MVPAQICEILNAILGPLTEIPILGEIFARILGLLCPEEEPVE